MKRNLQNRLTALVFVIASLYAYNSEAQVTFINTAAGNGSYGYSVDGIVATTAKLEHPYSVATDTLGNVYFVDGNRVRKVTISTGIITTVAGHDSIAGYSADGGLADTTELNGPKGVAVDKWGNIYIADYSNNIIRKVTASTGIITTIAGIPGSGSYNGDGIATSCQLHWPFGVAVDDSGNVYIADNYNEMVRKVTVKTGMLNTIAGVGVSGYSGDGGAATAAELWAPYAVAVDHNWNVYIAQYGDNVVREISSGIINTIAGGNSTPGFGGDGGLATLAKLNTPYGLALDDSSNLYIADEGNQRIRKITAATGKISTFAGTTSGGYNGDGIVATTAKLSNPYGVAVNKSGNVYIADLGNNRIRETYTGYAPVAYFVASDSNVCQHTTINFTDKSTKGPTHWSWTFTGGSPATDTLQNPSVLYNNAGTYAVKLKVTNGAGSDSLTKVGYIHVNALPTVTISGAPRLCVGPDELTALPVGTSPFTYKWSNTGTNDTIMAKDSNIYSVTITDANGCKASNSFFVNNDSAPAIRICMLSVDTASQHNIIVWDKTGVTHVDSFKIYYFDASNNWHFLGAQPFSAPGYYVDTAKINNPNANNVRYCLTSLDSCGKEEHFTASPWQSTTFIVVNSSGTFSWSGTGYLDKIVKFPVVTYYLSRDSISNGNWRIIDSVSGIFNQMTDPNFSSFPKGRWRVDALLNDSISNGCTVPLLGPVKSKTYNASHSNTASTAVITGVQNINHGNSISVYPNPADKVLNIKFNVIKAGSADISIMDMTGRLISETQNSVNPGSTVPLNIATMPTGIYFVKITTSTSSQVVKFVKE
ncbi:MAG TPA: T9SS type A sorting domain-containing protein [Bacteroidia bacterium]|nr:T9SS type A sorting domain-containing protein [Bacteroidia bacterium]